MAVRTSRIQAEHREKARGLRRAGAIGKRTMRELIGQCLPLVRNGPATRTAHRYAFALSGATPS
jgi:hypothetical protein